MRSAIDEVPVLKWERIVGTSGHKGEEMFPSPHQDKEELCHIIEKHMFTHELIKAASL